VLNFEKKSKIAKLAKIWDPYLDLGKEIAKLRRHKVSNFTAERYTLRIIWLTISNFPISFAKYDHRPKNWKIWLAPWDSLLGIRSRNFAEIWRPLRSNCKKKWARDIHNWEKYWRGAKIFTLKFLSCARQRL